MATTENNGLMIYQDESGNKFILYPITKADLVDGLEELLDGKAAAAHAGQHASRGSDPITPGSIGAQAALTFDTAPTSGSTNPVTSGGVYAALWELGTDKFGRKTGEIVNTVRADLGDQWLLCNGELIKEDEYPELFPLLKTGLLSSAYVNLQYNGSTSFPNPIVGGCKVNGKYIVLCYKEGSSVNTLTLYHSEDRYGPWTAVTIFSNSSTEIYYDFGVNIYYENGEYILLYADWEHTNLCLYHAVDLDGPWTYKLINDSYGWREAPSLVYGNGYYIIHCIGDGGSNDYSYLFHSTSLDGTWTRIGLNTNYDALYPVVGINLINGVFYVMVKSNDTQLKIVYFTDPATRTTVTVSGPSIDADTRVLGPLQFIDNKFVFLIYHIDYKSTLKIYAADSIDGTFEVVNTIDYSSMPNPKRWIFDGENYGLYMKSNTSCAVLWSNSLAGTFNVNHILSDDSIDNYTNSGRDGDAGVPILHIGKTAKIAEPGILPEITGDNMYYFIKAKQ